MTNKTNFKLGELFSGPGGIGIAAKTSTLAHGSKEFKISHVWANDFDKDSCETYRRNICFENPKSVVCKDIRKLDFRKLKSISEIDGLAFGFPCNDFSIVGEQKGIEGVYGPLYSFGIKALKMFKVDITSKSAIENPPIPQDAPNNEFTNHAKTVVERLKHIKPGENAFTADLPEHLSLNVRGAKISQIYKRLDPEKPAYTVTGSGGGGTHVYHWEEPRALTNRERARLQTFPDDFVFCGSKESVRKQIGMAVPPKGVKIIFESILKTIAGVEYKSVSPNLSIAPRLLEPSEEYLEQVS